jgi:uncharacterized membrane protein
VWAALVALVTLAYPLAVYWGLGHWEPKYLAGLLVLVALLRAFGSRDPLWRVAAVGAALLAGVSMVGNAVLPLKLYPVLVNAVLFVVFQYSLRHPPTVIERLARLQEPYLPESGVRYTRKVTIVWSVFFVVNGSIALGTALWASDATWALYNGLIAYGLMGLLFAVEWLVRQRVRRGSPS